MSYEFKGKHYIAKFQGCDNEKLIKVEKLLLACVKGIEDAGATVLDFCEYRFHNSGYTLVILLSESHMSLHTYPEINGCFIDLFTCGNCNPDKFHIKLVNYLKPTIISTNVIDR